MIAFFQGAALVILPILFVLVSVWLTVENFMRNPVRSGTGLVLVLLGVPVYYGMRRLRPAPEELP